VKIRRECPPRSIWFDAEAEPNLSGHERKAWSLKMTHDGRWIAGATGKSEPVTLAKVGSAITFLGANGWLNASFPSQMVLMDQI